MGDIAVEIIDWDMSSSGGTKTINTIGNMSDGFFRNNVGRRKTCGPTTSTANTDIDEYSGGAAITGITTLTGYRAAGAALTCKLMGEVWQYNGSGGGNDEFIVRGRFKVTIASGSTNNSASVSGISNRDDCVPFITGQVLNNADRTSEDQALAYAYIDGSDNLQVYRNNSGTALDVYVTVVEFTGSNWTVGHGSVTCTGGGTDTITLNTASTGSGGSTYNVHSWSNAFIEAYISGDSGTSNYQLEDTSFTIEPGSSTSQVDCTHESSASNNGTCFAHVVSNPGMGVYRATLGESIVPNGSYDNINWPSNAPTGSDMSEMALEWSVYTDGGGNAFARGAVGGKCYWSGSANFVRQWCHRSGNTGAYRYAVIDLSNLDGTAYPYISDCEDEQIDIGETNIVIDGANFEATQGTGKVELSDNADYATGTKVTQTIDSWSATQIQFDSVKGSLNEGNVWLWVTNNSGDRNLVGYKMNLGELSYESTIQNLNPDHLWMFNNDYADTGDEASHPANNAQDGTPSFTTATICRSNTHALNLEGGTESTSPANSNFMNIGTGKTRRTMGGWIEVDSIQTDMVCIYEEGAQIRNYCFIMGIGNQLLGQAVTEDAPTFNIQVYSERPIPINRPVHICFRFSGSGYDNKFDMFIDGKKMTRGYPADQEPDMTTLGNHSGNIEFGGSGTTLEVGGTDIIFGHVNSCKYAGWGTWANAATLTDTEIKEDLFEAGAKPENDVSGTESAMQTTITGQNSSTHPDWPLTYKINEPTDESNPEFTLIDQVFDEWVSLHVRWMGSGTLTLINQGTTNLDSTKISTPNSGTVTIINAITVTITCKRADTGAIIQGAVVLITAATGGDLPYEDSISITRSGTTATVTHTAHGLRTGQKVRIRGANQGQYNGIKTITVTTANAYTYTVSGSPATPATGTITATSVILHETSDAQGEVTAVHRYSSNQPISGIARKDHATVPYQTGNLSGTIENKDFDGTIFMIED